MAKLDQKAHPENHSLLCLSHPPLTPSLLRIKFTVFSFLLFMVYLLHTAYPPTLFFTQKVACVSYYMCSSALCSLQSATSPGNHSLILYRGLPQLFNSCVVLHLMGMPSFTQSCSCIWAFRFVLFCFVFCNILQLQTMCMCVFT